MVLESGDAVAEAPKHRLQRRVKQRRRKRRNDKRQNQNRNQKQSGGGKNRGLGAADCTVCAKGGAFGSIQAAIDAANAGDTVTVCSGTYTEDLSITKNLTLRGNDPSVVSIVVGAGTSSVVTIAPNVTATIKDMAFGRGVGTLTVAPQRVGGGIYNQGTLTLDFVTIGENTATLGGGIYNDFEATLFLSNGSSLAANNIATERGGAIFNDGQLTVDEAFVDSNTAAMNGGGILQQRGQITLQNGAVIDGNTAKNGGEVCLLSHPQQNMPGLTVIDSAISNNLVSEGGGGIFNEDGAVTLQAGTVFSNTAGGAVTLDAESAVVRERPEQLHRDGRLRGVARTLSPGDEAAPRPWTTTSTS